MRHARSDYDRIQDPANLIPKDEPVMILRGQDLAAPVALRAWVREAHRIGADNDLLIRVLDHAREMEEWQRLVARKVPDL
jgi:hypothetical protein